MYIYGGTKELDAHNHAITNDFYRLNLITLDWEDLTVRLFISPFEDHQSRRNVHLICLLQEKIHECISPEDPFERRMQSCNLPPRDNPTSALYRRSNRIFILIFGGADKVGRVTNDLLCIDPVRHTWETLSTTTTDKLGIPVGRSGAGSIVVDDKLFIFGGWTRSPDLPQDQTQNVDSFCVLDLKTKVWIAVDIPYPSHVGSLGYNLDVLAPEAYKGCKLLLMRNRTDDEAVRQLSTAYFSSLSLTCLPYSPLPSKATSPSCSIQRPTASPPKNTEETCHYPMPGTTSHPIEATNPTAHV